MFLAVVEVRLEFPNNIATVNVWDFTLCYVQYIQYNVQPIWLMILDD